MTRFGISFIFLGLLWNYDNTPQQSTKLYLMLGFSFLLGVIFSYLIWTMKRFAVFIVSMGLGVVIALQVYIFLAFYVEGSRKGVSHIPHSVCPVCALRCLRYHLRNHQ